MDSTDKLQDLIAALHSIGREQEQGFSMGEEGKRKGLEGRMKNEIREIPYYIIHLFKVT